MSHNGKCQTMDAVYNCRVTSPEPGKIYFGLADGKWKQGYYNHKKSFNDKRYSHETTLSTYVWHLKETLDVTKGEDEVHQILLEHLKKVSFVFL